jgi:hypothetical protein
MNRPILTCVFLAFATAALCAQQPASNPYQGQSNPPADDTITAQPDEPQQAPQQQPLQQAKPRAGKPLVQAAPLPASAPTPDQPMVRSALPSAAASSSYYSKADEADGTDNGIVRVVSSDSSTQQEVKPSLASRRHNDPDGDIVSAPLGPGKYRRHPDLGA